jgi:DNA-binding response OmpR family regulator
VVNATGVALVVEDDSGIGPLVRKALERSGFTVLEASSGEEALEVARAHEGPIHLLVTDVALPSMSGVELARSLASVRPGVKVLLISGYVGSADAGAAGLASGGGFLQKPFTLDALVGAVKELLGQRESRGAAV